MPTHTLSAAEEVDTCKIVLYYDNNFYQEPIATGDLKATDDVVVG